MTYGNAGWKIGIGLNPYKPLKKQILVNACRSVISHRVTEAAGAFSAVLLVRKLGSHRPKGDYAGKCHGIPDN
jgi:hypothetical protein